MFLDTLIWPFFTHIVVFRKVIWITGGPIQKWTEIDIEIRTCDVILERVLEPQAIFGKKKDLVWGGIELGSPRWQITILTTILGRQLKEIVKIDWF